MDVEESMQGQGSVDKVSDDVVFESYAQFVAYPVGERRDWISMYVCYCSYPENANDTVSVSFRRQVEATEWVPWVPVKGKPGRGMNKKNILRDARRKGKKKRVSAYLHEPAGNQGGTSQDSNPDLLSDETNQMIRARCQIFQVFENQSSVNDPYNAIRLHGQWQTDRQTDRQTWGQITL
uniref:Uncharacterized protein n=1 Tax=Timema poppense TaxID=170557 RepID=A0A7R9DRQ2_TIMPO|nr:unnamed protein product [Timema poppensis]